MVIDKPSGTLSLVGTIRTTHNWTYTAGTLDPGTSTVVFAGTLAIGGSHALTDVVFNGAGSTYTVAVGSTLTVTGSLTLTDGNINTGTVAAQGPISQASTFDGNTGTLLINGTAGQTLAGAATAAAGNLPNVVINKPSGALTLVGTIRTTHNWTYTAGALDPGASLVVFAGSTVTSAGMTFYDVMANGGTTTLGSAMTIGHNLTVSAGTFTTSASNFALSVGGSLAIAGTLRLNGSAVDVGGDISLSGTFVAGTSTVTLDGSAGQSLGGPSAMTFNNLVSSDPAGVVMASNVTVGSILTLAAGPFTVGAHTLTISNPLAGTITELIADGTSSIVVNGAAAGIVLPSSVVQLNRLDGQQRERPEPPDGPERPRDADPDKRPRHHWSLHADDRAERFRDPDGRTGQRVSPQACRRGCRRRPDLRDRGCDSVHAGERGIRHGRRGGRAHGEHDSRRAPRRREFRRRSGPGREPVLDDQRHRRAV